MDGRRSAGGRSLSGHGRRPGPTQPIGGVVVLALALNLAGCGTMDDASVAGGAAPVDGISGAAIRASDVETMEDAPWADAVLVAVPFDEADALWAATGVEPPAEPERAMVGLSQSALDDVEAISAETDDAGKFVLDVDAGGYLVCLGEPDGDRISTIGCGEIAAPALDIEISTGEAGFVVER